MPFPGKFAAVRRAVAHLLSDPELENVVCSFEQLISPLSNVGGVAGQDGFADVTLDLLLRAFKGKTVASFTDDLNVHLEVELGDLYCLRIRIEKDRSTIYRFIHQHDDSPPLERGNNSSHPLNKPSFKKKLHQLVPPDVVEKLIVFLEKEGKEQRKNKAKAARLQAARLADAELKEKKRRDQQAKRKVEKEAKKQQDMPKATSKTVILSTDDESMGGSGDESEDDFVEAVEAALKRQKTQRGTLPSEEVKLGLECLSLKEKILEDAARLADMRRQLKEMQERRHDKASTEDSPKKMNVHYTINGRVGSVFLQEGGLLFAEDMVKLLLPLPAEIDDANSERIHMNRSYEVGRYGKTMCWNPVGTSLQSNSNLAKMTKSATIVKKLRDKFSGQKCLLSTEALTRLAAWILANLGGSDESTAMTIAGTLDMLFFEIGFECDTEQLGKSCPSERTISRYECVLAADCLVKVLQEIRDDGAKVISILMDHGHRGQQDHYVIIIIWSGYDSDGNKTLKFFCPSIDSAGHTAVEAANGIKKVIDRHFGSEVDIEVYCATSDAGGGAAIQNVHPELVKLEVMTDDSKPTNCAMHGLQKPLENASILTMGDQGLGCRTPWQLVYVFSTLMKRLRELGGIEHVDELWAVVQQELQENPEWQSIAEHQMKQAWCFSIVKVEDFDETTDAGMDSLRKFMTESPRNIQDPVWTRWGSIVKTTEILLDNWVSVYFLAVGCKGHFKSESQIWKLACSLISLMNERAVPELNSVEEVDQWIDSFSDANAEEREGEGFIDPVRLDVDHWIDSFSDDNTWERGCEGFIDSINHGDTPTFYAMLLFHRGFCRYLFNDNFDFMMRNDFYFGHNTFGQLARFMAERCYVMFKQLQDLKDGGWKTKPQFKEFITSLKGVPTKSKHVADRTFFTSLPDYFIKVFESSLVKHILDRWRDDKLLVYQIGGQPELAQEFSRMLVHHKKNVMGAVDENDEAISRDDLPKYSFPDQTITLGNQHTTTKDHPIKVNVKECMEFTTAKADLDKVIVDKFVVRNWTLIEELAAAEDTVRLFDKLENGKIDKSTWGGVDFEPLLEDIWRVIAIHSHHQQRCENYVQMAALIAKTLVEEARRTWRSIGTSTIIRPFNAWAVEKLRKKEKDVAKREKITRVRGSKRIEYFAEFLNEFRSKVGKAMAEITKEKYDAILESIEKADNKSSAAEKTTREKGFAKSVKKKVKAYKAEQVSGYELTALVGGKAKLSELTITGGHEHLINAELLARKITTEMEEFTEEYGENADIGTVPFLQKKSFIRLHEAKRINSLNRSMSLDDAVKKCKEIKPVSDALLNHLANQHSTQDQTTNTA